MRRRQALSLLAVLVAVGQWLAATAPDAAAAPEPAKLRRFALIVGANDGGSDRVKLRFATSDAEAMARVVSEIGGIGAGDAFVLLDPSRAGLDRAFDEIEQELAAARHPWLRVELIIYYSGHSDEQGLLLSGERYTYRQLRERIRRMPSDVNIAILDSCASGSFTRLKGGTRKPAFLVDESSKVKGYAFLTSSSEDEAAQESDRLGSSFFTHYLVSGLRGGADTNRDGRVTLNEAYQFAFSETVARTETTQAGAQHPAYDMHLVGSGDVVMTDLRATGAALVVDKDVDGRLFIRDGGGLLVVEISKPRGRQVVLGLGAARYDVTLQRGNQLYRASVALRQGKRTLLAAADFSSVEGEPTVARGAPGVMDQPEPAGPHALRRVPFSITFIPSFGIGGGDDTLKHVSINVLAGRGGSLQGAEVGGLVNYKRYDVRGAQVAGLANIVGGRVEGAQAAGLVNVTNGPVEAVQVAGLANLGRGPARGIQLAGLGNRAGSLVGVQLSGIANQSSGNVRGLQLSGIANVSEGWLRGAQVALVNVGNDVKGAQIGLVNVAKRIDGLQLGLVNVASEQKGAPIGLVSLVRGGRHALELWTSDTAVANVGLKLGSRYLYTILAVAADQDQWMHGFGFGIHVPARGRYVDVDAMAWQILDYELDRTENDLLSKLRLAVGWNVNPDFALFAGASISAALAWDDKEGAELSFLDCRRVERHGVVLRLWPGVFAGLGY